MPSQSLPPPGKLPARDTEAPGMATGGAGLTAREDQVLALLHQDKSDGEIAQALGISRNTVLTHVKHIRRKLGIRHRRWLRTNGAQ